MTTMRASITPLLSPQFRDVYMEVGDSFALEYPIVMNVLDMEWNPVTDKQISGLATMPEKPENMQFTTDSVILGGTKSYEAVPYGLAVEISSENLASNENLIMLTSVLGKAELSLIQAKINRIDEALTE